MKGTNTQDAPDEIKQAQRAYYKAWRDRNPDKVKQIRARFWARQKERMKGGGVNDS